MNTSVKYAEKKFEESKLFLNTLYVVALTYIGFSVADFIKYPEHFYEFLVIRISFCLFIAGSFLYIKLKEQSYASNQIIIALISFFASSGISYMMWRTDGPASIYFSGINLVALFALSFSVFEVLFFAAAIACVYLPYYVLCYLQFESFGDWRNFVIYNAFNVGTIVGVVLAKIRREQALSWAIQAELRLEHEITEREAIIAEKTAEAVSAKFNETMVNISQQVAHDIRSPLSVVNLLLPSITEAMATDKKTAISEALKRINQISEDLLTVGKKNNLRSDYCIESALRGICNEKEIQFNFAIKLTSKLNGLRMLNLIDEVTFKRILSNLLNNSIESLHSKVNGQIEIRTEYIDHKLAISISDNGCGIPPELLSKIGDKGFSTGKSGHGLGVYHAKCAIESFGGSFSIISKTEGGAGTLVTLVLPFTVREEKAG